MIYVHHNDEESIPPDTGVGDFEVGCTERAGKNFDKHYNSAFKGTGLHAYLQQEGVGRLILIGMSTNYCIDATVKVAFELGYEVAVVEHGTTTFADPDIAADILIDYH
ncbi:nicotinamidase/pyrazinamidase [Chlamydia trachomatis]|nr:nicotinamidase/pyrazinamidase [Chlamydia trachomatis]